MAKNLAIILRLLTAIHLVASVLAIAASSQDEELDVFNGTTAWDADILSPLVRRQRNEVIRCDKNTPCSNGDCCNGDSGFCGRRPEFCDKSVCTSNCEAKPECGIRADKFDCPLNVCCSYWGNCGSTADFCDERCQGNCAKPPSTGHSQVDVRELVIGYYESWTLAEKGCRVMPLSSIPVSSLTHINVAFGYIKPNSYIVHPMEPATDQIFSDLTELKQRAPGLQIWLSLGGWTFSDNGTSTQPVFGDLSSTPAKRAKFIDELVKFMRHWGFDGVDIDWEYPGAPDRGGNEWVDTENYVALLAALRSRFDAEPEGWGISFAAPTSYWYLRWFDIENMMPYVNWVNLMSYDLHGSWDTEESYVGNFVNSHTNLTEIQDALELLWRNNVPASQVNLGIGFYGRSFKLEDPSCNRPGCKQKGPADAGDCTGQAGVLSYEEVESLVKKYHLNVVHDKTAGVKYLSWNNDQWIAYDDADTLQEKVAFANQQGLGGLMIWAIDLDDKKSSALDALLQPDGLGKFAKRNGVSAELGDWTRQGAQCELGPCSEKPSCPRPGYLKHGHDLECPKKGERRNICCDSKHFPKESTCKWHDGQFDPLSFLGPGLICNGAACPNGHLLMVENDRFWVDNPGNENDGDARCFLGGKAKYCCESQGGSKYDMCEPLKDSCDYKVKWPDFGSPQHPDTSNMCGSGKYFLSYAEGDCSIFKLEFQPICCPNETPRDACFWPDNGEDKCNQVIDSCPRGATAVEGSPYFAFPDAVECTNTALLSDPDYTRKPLCCWADKLQIETKDVPVRLDYLFPKVGPESNEEKFNLQVDTGEGAGGDADGNAFGFVVMSGPKKDLISVDKRDGSHWELLDCEKHDKRQTIRAVCTDTGPNSNCGDIFLGQVAETIVEMPPHCGAGRYAVAVALVPSKNQTLSPDVDRKLRRRRGTVAMEPRMYDFTFDYDFGPIHARDKSDVLMRVDYSTDPGYWGSIVDKAGERKRSVQEHHEIVKRNHGGSWPSYLHHHFRKQKRETPEHQMEEFHKRWFSSDLGRWLDEIREVDIESDLARYRIYEHYTWDLFDQSVECVNYRARMKSWIDLDIDVDITASISLIGDLADPKTWDQTALLFRTKGGIKTKLTVEAYAELFFSTGPVELFGAQNFGLTFAVPGVVTIGPNFRIIGQINGFAALHLDASVQHEVVEWDYTQRYPIKGKGTQVKDATIVDKKGDAPKAGVAGPDDEKEPTFQADVTANGAITVSITPRVEFGIVFNYEAIPDSLVTMALENQMTLWGDAGFGLQQTAFICYGIDGRSNLYAAVNAPHIFGVSLSNRWDIFDKPFTLIPRTCPIGA